MLGAVVVNYRTPDDLEAFLRSWEAHRGQVSEQLVIINVAPTLRDCEVALAAQRDLDDVFVVSFEENIGYARSCNTGASYGDSEVLAFFNADVQLTAGALEGCYNALVSHDDWGVLGPRQVDLAGKITHAGIVGTNVEPKHRAWHHRDTGQFTDIVEDCPTVSGAAYFIKRAVWDELTECPLYREIAPHSGGAFLPTQLYHEETWCSYHARAPEHNYKVVFYGEATIIHKWHRAVQLNDMEAQSTRWFRESQEYFRKACDHHGIDHN